MSSAATRLLRALSLTVGLSAASAFLSSSALAEPDIDFFPLKSDAKNFNHLFSSSLVKTGNSTPETDSFRAGREIVLAIYGYLHTDSPVPAHNRQAFLDRLLVLLDHRLGNAANGTYTGWALRDIGWAYHSAYAYWLLKKYAPDYPAIGLALTPQRRATYETGLGNMITSILAENSLVYDQGVLANLWLNGDMRLAMGVYFGALARGEPAVAEKARAAIDGVLAQSGLTDGGTRYVGFWTEVPSYHQDTVEFFIYWWLFTGSTSIKAALDATRLYSPVVNEPCGFVEQSSNIPYKHMYNNRHGAVSSLWKAYLYDDGYNFHFGKNADTTNSPELLNTVLFQPNRQTLTPPTHVGAFFDGNVQGPRGRFNGTWGWVANGRDVQRGGPEAAAYSNPQGFQSRMVGKTTFVGAFALGARQFNTTLKGALDSVNLQFKETPGVETNWSRGTHYRFLAQDEQTQTITRKNFGTLSTTYNISKRFSSSATPTWDSTKTNFDGQQLWVLTDERIIGLVQVSAKATSTVYGLDARLVFAGGRQATNMGSYHELVHDAAAKTLSFGQLKTRYHNAHATAFAGPVTHHRINISETDINDDRSALVRLHDVSVNPALPDQPLVIQAGTRRWVVLDITRTETGFATNVINVLPAHASYAVLQFHEGKRRVRIVQNLTPDGRNYNGTFSHGSAFTQTSLHRSWSTVVSPLTITNNAVSVSDWVPPYAHMIAVNSHEPDDHTNAFRTPADFLPEN